MATNSGNHKKNAGKNAPQRGTASKGTAPRTGGKKMSAKQRKAKKRKRIILFTVEIVALVVLLAALVSVLMITKMDKVKINPEDIAVNPEVEENTEMKGYRNIALFGVDSRTGKLGKGNRSDTIMIASINQDTGDVKLVSVYRDTYLNLGTDAYNKANAAYAKGGPEQAINMLNMCFDLNIQEYVTVGFDALIETIDALGGIQIDVHENEIEHLNNYQRSMFSEDENDALNENIVKVTKPGLQTLNGLQATAYCRIRYVGDDFGRAERQRKVLLACLDKAKQANPATLVEILNKVLEHVYTNIGVEEMASVLKDVASYEVVAQDGIPFESARKTGTVGKKGSCVIPVDLAENVKMLHEFLFDAADYVPSEQVQQCSQQISSDTGVYKK